MVSIAASASASKLCRVFAIAPGEMGFVLDMVIVLRFSLSLELFCAGVIGAGCSFKIKHSTARANPSCSFDVVMRRRALHVRTGVAHGDAESARGEHQDIVWPIADRGNLRRWYPRHFRKTPHHVSLVGLRVGYVEVIWL